MKQMNRWERKREVWPNFKLRDKFESRRIQYYYLKEQSKVGFFWTEMSLFFFFFLFIERGDSEDARLAELLYPPWQAQWACLRGTNLFVLLTARMERKWKVNTAAFAVLRIWALFGGKNLELGFGLIGLIGQSLGSF